MASKEANISSLYTELNKLGQNGEYERAIKTANKILQQSPEEEEAFHCKIVCLLQSSKFQDALQQINKQPKLPRGLIFEKAYCEYRLNQPAEALKTVNSAINLDQKLRELKAQILYRLEEYDECFELYKSTIKNSNDEYEDERETNLSAVVANLCINNSTKEIPKLREHTFELVYNSACQLVGKGLYMEAEEKLKNAEKLCTETLEEDGTAEEDIEAELGIIRGQLAYCLQMQGREKEAQNIYNALLKSKPTDVGLVAVASNNSVTINKGENIFDSKKKMKSAIAGVEHKLTRAQRRTIALNQCLLTIATNQGELGKQLCAKLVDADPDSAADVALIQATQMMKDNKTKEAVKFLEKFAEDHKKRELELKLACVQLLLSCEEKKEACRILESLGDTKYKPGIISALVTLYLSESNLEKASAVFKDAVDWYKNRASNQGDLSALWRQAADFHLRNGDPRVAANSLEELLRLNPNDNKTLAQLVTAYAIFDPAKAQAVSKRLPQFSMTNADDIEMLESSNWLMSTKAIKKVTKVEASPKPGAFTEDELIKKKKKTKKRKGKLPKNYDPGVPPDPERWLPKYERTGYKKKKDRRNKDVGKGTQGAATGASDMYDITKMPSHASKNSPNPSSPASDSHGPRQQHRRFQQKKKKKVHFKLENYFDKSRLTLQDFDFIEDVESDVGSFVEGRKEKRVLVFPPVNSYRRFLIHKLVNVRFPALTTFSIGVGEERRLVICFKKDYIQPQIVKPKETDSSTEKFDEGNRIGELSPPVRPKRERRSNAMPSINIYRPPAARKREQNVNCGNIQDKEPIKDSFTGNCKCPSENESESGENSKRKASSGISMFKNAITSIRTQNQSSNIKSPELSKKTDLEKSNQARPRRPDMKVYVPKARRLAVEQPKLLVVPKMSKISDAIDASTTSREEENGVGQKDSGYFGNDTCIDEAKTLVETRPMANKDDGLRLESVMNNCAVFECEKVSCHNRSDECDKNEVKESDSRTVLFAEKSSSNKVGKSELFYLKVEPEVTHQISPTSLWIEAQNEVSAEEDKKVMISSQKSATDLSSSDSSRSNSLEGSLEKINEMKKEDECGKNIRSVHLNPEECDWESMFDESGECLDPTLLKQLSSAVGAVTIEKPKSNYETFKNKAVDLITDEFPHVIEIYNFPPEFQLQDLITVFSQFKNSGFEIKWVDDTHALGIFSNSQIVSEVLAFRHPFVKTRSLKDGTLMSKAKARRSADQLLPYKQRPDTCPALAKRLVTGALGVRLPTSREEREAERKLLMQAREKKKLEAKQREEAWEGTFH